MKTDTLGAVAITFMAVIIIALASMKHCGSNQHRPQVNADSLIFANKTLEKQYGMMSAEAQAQGLRASQAEMKARQRDTIYITRTKTIFKSAPDTCQPYLIAMQNECDTLIEMHRMVSLAKDTLLAIKDSIIVNRNSVIANDSVIIAKSDAAKKKAEKQAKRSKFITKVVGIAAAVAVVFSFGWAVVN